MKKLTVEHPKLGRTTGNVSRVYVKFQCLSELSPPRAFHKSMEMMLVVKVDEFVFIYHSAPKKLFRICISYFLLVAFPMSFLPSFRTMLPESSHIKNLAGVFSRPAIRAF
jgi:hypothetical protein